MVNLQGLSCAHNHLCCSRLVVVQREAQTIPSRRQFGHAQLSLRIGLPQDPLLALCVLRTHRDPRCTGQPDFPPCSRGLDWFRGNRRFYNRDLLLFHRGGDLDNRDRFCGRLLEWHPVPRLSRGLRHIFRYRTPGLGFNVAAVLLPEEESARGD